MKPVVLIFLFLLIEQAYACPKCLDTSWHLTRPNDTKEYHTAITYYDGVPYTCQCPCRRLTLNRGECLECHHRHVMEPLQIIRSGQSCR